jgi:hypothetical protein
MRHFYDELGDGMTVAAALHGARQAIRARPETSHAFFWRGFVLVGDGDVTLELQRRRDGWRSYAMAAMATAAAAVFVAILLMFRNRRRRLGPAPSDSHVISPPPGRLS